MASYGVDLVDEASTYILEHSHDDEACRLHIQISHELLCLVDGISQKTGRSRSFVIEQLLYHSVSNFSSSERLL